VNANGQGLAWSSYLGGSGGDVGYGIAVDGSGNVFVTGYTQSTDFPTAGGFDTTLDGYGDAFVVRIGRANGTNCASASECVSGYCVDGVCCDSACGGGVTTDCQACSVAAGAAVNGTCGFVSAGRTCRASAGVCDVAETCTGTSAACPADAFAPPTTVCRPAGCVGDTAVKEASCTGASADCPSEITETCAPGACNAGVCMTGGGTGGGGDVGGGAGGGGAGGGGAGGGGAGGGGAGGGTGGGAAQQAGGCGCTAAPSLASLVPWAFIALTLAARRRRRSSV
jgi:hypothetical protein